MVTRPTNKATAYSVTVIIPENLSCYGMHLVWTIQLSRLVFTGHCTIQILVSDIK